MSKRCSYCNRVLEPRGSSSRVAETRDHVHPLSKGGKVTVPSCRQCNTIKGDMLFPDWQLFMAANPEWWKRPEYQVGTYRPRPWVPGRGLLKSKRPRFIPRLPVELMQPQQIVAARERFPRWWAAAVLDCAPVPEATP